MQQIGELHRLRLDGVAGKAWNVWGEFHSEHEAKPANLDDDARILFRDALQAVFQEFTGFPRVVREFFAMDYFENFQRDGAGHWRAAVRRAMAVSSRSNPSRKTR